MAPSAKKKSSSKKLGGIQVLVEQHMLKSQSKNWGNSGPCRTAHVKKKKKKKRFAHGAYIASNLAGWTGRGAHMLSAASWCVTSKT